MKERKMETIKKPRRGRGRRSPKRIYSLWARVGFLVAMIFVFIVAAAALIAKAYRPYQELHVQKKALAVTQHQIQAVDDQNAILERRIHVLQTPSGIATEARTMGFVRKGEVPIMIPGGPNRWAEHPVTSRGGEVDRSLSARWRGFWQRITGKQ